MREYRKHDGAGYVEGQEMNQKVMNYISSGLEMDDVLNSVYLKVAYFQLSAIQRCRLTLYFFCGFSEREIAELEGVSHQAIHKSITSAIEELRYMLDLDNK